MLQCCNAACRIKRMPLHLCFDYISHNLKLFRVSAHVLKRPEGLLLLLLLLLMLAKKLLMMMLFTRRGGKQQQSKLEQRTLHTLAPLHARTRAPSPTRPLARTHARTLARTLARTHAH
jgi:hypothetical protein